MKILSAQLNYTVGDFSGNVKKILFALDQARLEKAEIVVFSELALSGYPPEDLLLEEGFLTQMEAALQEVIRASGSLFVVIGLARKNPSGRGKPLFNSAAVIENGKLLGFHDKWRLPTYDVFDEDRYFEPGTTSSIWNYKGKKIATLICEDIWQQSAFFSYPNNPVKPLEDQNIDLLINISASPYQLGKLKQRFKVGEDVVRTLKCPLLFCAQVGANDQLIFDGHSFFMNKEGKVLSLAKGFKEDLSIWDLEKPKQEPLILKEETEDLFSALVLGVHDYFQKSGLHKACLGLSGGIDSAVVASLAVAALGKENVLVLYMPSRYSSEMSEQDAKELARNLEIPLKEISIEAPFQSYLDLLAPEFRGRGFDVTEENIQARIRGMLLMAFSNKFGYIVLCTGNKSEMALGFTTLYGDLCGGLSVISDLTKSRVYELADFINKKKEIIPLSTLRKEPTAELRENQKDSDSLPDYAILDAIIELHIEQGKSAQTIATEKKLDFDFVKEIIRRMDQAEYKRRQAPPGLRVTQKSFQKGRTIPIVQKWK